MCSGGGQGHLAERDVRGDGGHDQGDCAEYLAGQLC